MTSQVFAGIFWIAFDKVDFVTITVFIITTSGFIFLQAIGVTYDVIVGVVARTSASVTIITYFIPRLTVAIEDTVDFTFFSDDFWVFTSFVGVVDSMGGWELVQKHSWEDLDWVDAEDTVVVGIIAVTSTAKTESTLSVGSGVTDRPFLVDWVVMDSEFEFGQIKSNVGTLESSRVSGIVLNVHQIGKWEFFDIIPGKNKVISQSPDVTFNVVFNDKSFDLVLNINNNFKVHVASVMGDSMFTSVRVGKFKGLAIVSLDQILVSSRTLTVTFTANVRSAAFTVSRIGWNISSFLTVWTIWLSLSANFWITSEFSFSDAFAFLTNIVKNGTWSNNLSVVFATASFLFVRWAAVSTVYFNEFHSVDAFVVFSWLLAENWFTSASWLWATFTVRQPLEFVTFRVARKSSRFEDSWFVTSRWVADTSTRVATSTSFSGSRSDMSEFGANVFCTSISTWKLSTFDSTNFAVFGFNAFTLVATFSPSSTATVGFFGQWIFAVLLVDFASFTTSTWHDHSGVTFTASDLGAWFLEALFHSVDTFASTASLLPSVARWNQSAVDFAAALTWFDHVFSVAKKSLSANSSRHISNRHSALRNIGDMWTSWDLAIAGTGITRIATVFGTITSS